MEDRYYLDRRIHELLKKGKFAKTIADELDCSLGRVYYQKQKRDQGLDWRDRPRAGAPPKLPKEKIPLVKRVLKRKAVQTPERAAKILRTELALDVSGRTVRRAIKKAGMRYRIKPKKPTVTAEDKVKRVQFAKRRRPKGFWNLVWWSDEKAFEIHYEPRGMWVDVRDEPAPRKKGLVTETVRVWAAISHAGKSELYQIPSYWNADDYKAHLETKALLDLRTKSPNGFVFEQDADGAHTAKKVQNFLKEEEVDVLDDYPVHSPDISPIENIWKLLMDKMKYRNPKTKAGFFKALKEEWENISLEEVRNLTDTFKHRLSEIIRVDGEPIKY
jgi:transposase